MTTKCVTLSVSKALALAGISNCEHLPLVIRMDEKALVLSEKRDCYFTTTASECSCIQFISGVHPCPHQIRAFEHDNSEKVAQEAGEAIKERLEIDQKERLKSEQEESKEERWKIELEKHLKAEIAFEQSQCEFRERLKTEWEKQKDQKALEARLKKEHREQIKEQQIKDRLQISNQIMQLNVKRKTIDEAMREVPLIEGKTQLIKKRKEDKIIAHVRDD